MFGSLSGYHCDFQLSPRKWRVGRRERKKVTRVTGIEATRGRVQADALLSLVVNKTSP